MARRRAGSGEAFELGLDSFTDIMTNVVAILIFLALIGLTSGGGVKFELGAPIVREPAPGAKPFIFECRGDAVYAVDLESIQEQVKRAAEEIEREPGFAPESGFDRLAKRRFEGPNHVARVKLEPQPHLALEPKAGPTGTPEARLEGEAEEFLGRLATLDAKSRFVFFYVRPDAFASFRKARAIAIARGFEVGWQPLPEDRPLGFVGQGGIALSPQR